MIRKLVLMMAMALVVAMPAVAQNASTVSVSASGKTIAQVLADVEKRHGYVFLYDDQAKEATRSKTTISMKDVSINRLMDTLLSGTGLNYKVNGRQVMVFGSDGNSSVPASQRYTATGHIMDENGDPLPGANVIIVESGVGTAANAGGVFTLRVPSGDSKLRITFVGYEQAVISASEAQKGVIMKPLANMLGNATVVADGYNVIDRRLSASSTFSLDADELMMDGVPQVSQMLQGKVPGLTVVTPSGSPNAAPRMRMRGSSTIHGDAAPVWVVDGVIWDEAVNVSNDEVNAILRGNATLDQVNENASMSLLGNAITGLNPHDIESITFLKDASATAIYGTRAANGVIVVKTRKGREGRTAVNFSSSLGFTSRPRYSQYNMMDSKERIGLSKDMVKNGYVFDIKPYSTGFEGALYDLYDKKITDDEFAARVADLETRNTDWFGRLFQHALNQDYNVNVSGGSGQMRYYTSMAYSSAKGTSRGDNMRRINMNMSLDTRLFDFLQMGTKLSYSDRTSDGFYMVNPFDYAIYASRALAPDEFYTQTQTRIEGTNNNYMLRYNIFNELDHTSNTTTQRQMNAQLTLRTLPWHGLALEGLFAYSATGTLERQWADEQSYYIAGIRGYEVGAVLPGSDDEKASRLARGGILLNSDQKQRSWTSRVQANYSKTFGNDYAHTVQAMVGFEARSLQYDGLKAQEYGYFPDRGNKVSFEYNNTVSGSTDWHSSLDKHTSTVVSNLSNTISEYGTFVYSYKNRYVLNANLRLDASNRFGQYTNHKFQPVWSAAFRWNMADEAWFPHNHNEELSLRASYGMQGNIPSSVGPNLVVRYPSAIVNRWSGEYQLQISRLPYPNLRWEKTRTVNLGLEWSMFDHRVSGTVDYYYKKGTDILFQLPVALEYGQEQVYRNGADLTNQGVELSMTFVPVRTKNMEWSITPIWSKNTNQVANVLKNEYTVEDYLSGNAFEEGKPVNAIYSWKFTGLDPETGYATFAGTSKTTGGVGEQVDVKDLLEYSGSKDPKFSGGFSTMLRYKQWTMNMNWSFQWGNVVRLNYLFEGNNLMPQPYANLSRRLLKAWQQPGDEATTNIPGFNRSGQADYYCWYNTTTNGVRSSSSYTMYNYSDLRIVKGDFLRCRNLSIGYSFPYAKLKAVGIQSLSISASVSNPITICSSKFEGQDPETQGTGTTAVPITQNYTFGVSVGF